MAKYNLLIKPSAVKEIEPIPSKRDRRLVVQRILRLPDNPRPPGSEKLSGHDKYRIRQGRYRILYTVDDNSLLVCVIKVGQRNDVYR